MTARRPRFHAWQAIAFQGGIALVALIAVLVFSIPLRNHGLSGPDAVLLGSLAGAATYGVLYLVSRVPGFHSPAMSRHLRDLRGFVLDYSWPVLITLALLAGVGEELLFRGVIQGWPAAVGFPWLGLLAGALLFGLAHCLSFAYFAVTTLMGLALGLVYMHSNSLLLVMVWHGVYDLIAIYVLRHYPQAFGLEPG